MYEDDRKYVEARALAAELLRCQRHDDRAGFLTALNRTEPSVKEILISLTGLANHAMDAVISREAADELVEQLASQLPPPPDREEVRADAWRDAIALLEAVNRDDVDAARAIMRHTPDLMMAFGSFVQVTSDILRALPDSDALVAAVAELGREEGPPEF